MIIKSKAGRLAVPKESVSYFGIRAMSKTDTYMAYVVTKYDSNTTLSMYETPIISDAERALQGLLDACIKDDKLQQAIATATPIAQIALKAELVDSYTVG